MFDRRLYLSNQDQYRSGKDQDQNQRQRQRHLVDNLAYLQQYRIDRPRPLRPVCFIRPWCLLAPGFFVFHTTDQPMRTYDKLIATIPDRRSLSSVRPGFGDSTHPRR